MNSNGPETVPWERIQQRSLLVGGAGLALCLLLALINARAFFQAYLVAYLFWLGIALGSLAILMLHYLVGGGWGFLIRRPLEASVMTIPLMALLFLPLLLGLGEIYPWARPAEVHASAALQHKDRYFHYFTARAALYFAIWAALAVLLNRGSRRQDQTEDPSPTWRLQQLCAPGLALHFLCVTFASIDWAMSIEVDWYSTIYGVMLFIGQALSALAVMAIVASLLAHVKPLSEVALPNNFHDVGNLLLAFVMLWAYMSFSQLLIVWSGNLPDEVPWYLNRSVGGWRLLALSLIVFHFFLPFFCLLFRVNKRDGRRLWRVALAIVVMQYLNDIWLIIPSFRSSGWLTGLLLVTTTLGIGGLWSAAFTWQLKGRPLLPRHDPLLAAALEHEHHGGG